MLTPVGPARTVRSMGTPSRPCRRSCLRRRRRACRRAEDRMPRPGAVGWRRCSSAMAGDRLLSRWASSSSTQPMSAVTHCPQVTSCQKSTGPGQRRPGHFSASGGATRARDGTLRCAGLCRPGDPGWPEGSESHRPARGDSPESGWSISAGRQASGAKPARTPRNRHRNAPGKGDKTR